jgi:hypothetical protein
VAGWRVPRALEFLRPLRFDCIFSITLGLRSEPSDPRPDPHNLQQKVGFKSKPSLGRQLPKFEPQLPHRRIDDYVIIYMNPLQ